MGRRTCRRGKQREERVELRAVHHRRLCNLLLLILIRPAPLAAATTSGRCPSKLQLRHLCRLEFSRRTRRDSSPQVVHARGPV